MVLMYDSIEQADPDFTCPVCGHRILPPQYPYCGHIAFVHYESGTGDAGFDHVDQDFAERYLAVLKKAAEDPAYDEAEHLDTADCRRFLAGELPSIDDQVIPLDVDLIDELVFPGEALIVTIFESVGFYPTTVRIAIRRP